MNTEKELQEAITMFDKLIIRLPLDLSESVWNEVNDLWNQVRRLVEQQSQPPKGVEEAAGDHADEFCKSDYEPSIRSHNAAYQGFIAGAKWQSKHEGWIRFSEWIVSDACPFIFSENDGTWYQYADMFQMSTEDLFNYYKRNVEKIPSTPNQ